MLMMKVGRSSKVKCMPFATTFYDGSISLQCCSFLSVFSWQCRIVEKSLENVNVAAVKEEEDVRSTTSSYLSPLRIIFYSVVYFHLV